jgi:ribosome-associated translation inhibitor RaiA
MMTPEAVARAKAERANFVHVTLRGVEETDALEQYIQDRVNRQARKGPEVLWYEVVLQGNTWRPHRPCSARVTAHLRDQEVFVAHPNQDPFLAARDVFDVLARRLHRVRDVRKSRARGSLGHTCNAGHS